MYLVKNRCNDNLKLKFYIDSPVSVKQLHQQICPSKFYVCKSVWKRVNGKNKRCRCILICMMSCNSYIPALFFFHKLMPHHPACTFMDLHNLLFLNAPLLESFCALHYFTLKKRNLRMPFKNKTNQCTGTIIIWFLLQIVIYINIIFMI